MGGGTEFMDYRAIAMKYLAQLLNSKTKEIEIPKIVEEIKGNFPDESTPILNELQNELKKLAEKQIIFEKRSFTYVAEANDNYLEYLELLNTSIQGKKS